MRIVAITVLVVVALAAGAAALAQAPATPAGNYGGGHVKPPPAVIATTGNMLISLRVTSPTRATLNAGLAVRCGSGYVRTTVALAPDGSFTASDTITRRFGGGRTVRSTYRIRGTVAGAVATGDARLSNRVRQDGRTIRTCATGNVLWATRRASGDIGAPGTVAGAALFGTTSQRLEGVRRAIGLRVSRDTRKVSRALYDVTLRCDSRAIAALYGSSSARVFPDVVDAPRRNLRMAADQTFADVERFTTRLRTTILRSTERFAGRLGTTGARGTQSIDSRLADRRSGRTLGRCRSGTVDWVAAN